MHCKAKIRLHSDRPQMPRLLLGSVIMPMER